MVKCVKLEYGKRVWKCVKMLQNANFCSSGKPENTGIEGGD